MPAAGYSNQHPDRGAIARLPARTGGYLAAMDPVIWAIVIAAVVAGVGYSISQQRKR